MTSTTRRSLLKLGGGAAATAALAGGGSATAGARAASGRSGLPVGYPATFAKRGPVGPHGTQGVTGPPFASAGTLTEPQYITGVLRFGPEVGVGPIIVREATDDGRSAFEWQHNAPDAYLLHLTCGPDMGASGPALIGLGGDYGGRCLFINNKATGQGLVVTQNSTITSTGAYGILVNAGAGAAPGMMMQQNAPDGSLNAQPVLVLHAYRSFDNAQRLMEWRKPNAGYDGDLAGYIRAYDGGFVVQAPMIVSGADLSAQANTGVGGNITGVTVSARGAAGHMNVYDTSGTANSRRFKIQNSSGSFLVSARNDDGTAKKTLIQIDQNGVHTFVEGANFVFGTTTGTKFGTATTQKQAWWGATPVVRPTGVAVNAAGIHAALVTLGLIAA